MWGKEISQRLMMARSPLLLLLETISAKEDKSRCVVQWKTPRLSFIGQAGDYSTD